MIGFILVNLIESYGPKAHQVIESSETKKSSLVLYIHWLVHITGS